MYILEIYVIDITNNNNNSKKQLIDYKSLSFK